MGFCKRKGVDCECLTDHSTCNSDNCHKKLPDISQKRLEEDKIMTFKEKLIERAERASEINIEEEMNVIKTRMAENADERVFTIALVKSKTRFPLITGIGVNNQITLFVPKRCNPHRYRQQFVDALLDLGFEEEDISLEIESSDVFDSYDIKVTW